MSLPSPGGRRWPRGPGSDEGSAGSDGDQGGGEAAAFGGQEVVGSGSGWGVHEFEADPGARQGVAHDARGLGIDRADAKQQELNLCWARAQHRVQMGKIEVTEGCDRPGHGLVPEDQHRALMAYT